ncbi:hypothetical protein H6G00_28875 [Leptolyngbya sp. FACHB-541]|uniref:hypothetical protein n=1 Tax=Leptolyngbya sp. FACHB-541 TaxID=2692810 RepID=UPI00168707F4|nr:hypothetical protein [Leptolyngbya sp. FACHB-541]MBD2000572.1 hypothetical protein [Leptolyngbya sp. FACHB-541]
MNGLANRWTQTVYFRSDPRATAAMFGARQAAQTLLQPAGIQRQNCSLALDG